MPADADLPTCFGSEIVSKDIAWRFAFALGNVVNADGPSLCIICPVRKTRVNRSAGSYKSANE